MRRMILAVLGAAAFFCAAADVRPEDDGWWRRDDGYSKVFAYETKDRTPIVVSGESRARQVKAGEYCLYLDVYYADGTADWRIRTSWQQGTHDWERIDGYFVPRAAVEKVEAYAFVRHGRGSAEYRNLRVAREEPARPLPPGLTRRNPVAGKGCRVWCADSMTRVTPALFPSSFDAAPQLAFDLAANERESQQLVLTAGPGATGEVSVAISLPGLAATWARVGFFRRGPAYDAHSHGVPPAERFLPDPLLPAAPFALRGGYNHPLWVTVFAPPGTKPGRYAGTVSLSRAGTVFRRVPVSVRVRGFELPHRFTQKATYSVMDGFTRKFYRDDFAARRRESWDLMLDARLSPDDIARTEPPPLEDVAYALERGMNLFAIANFVPPSKNPNACWTCVASPEACFDPAFYDAFAARLKPYVAELRRRGWLKYAFFYGFDERDETYFEGMRTVRAKLRRDFPDVPLLTTAFVARPLATGALPVAKVKEMADIVCPVMDAYDGALAGELRRQGVDVWWYVCGGNPREPYVNLSSTEYPPVDARLASWMTYVSGAGGFLYWAVNCWDDRLRHLDEREMFFDEWRLWQSKSPSDGVLLYPGRRGILPSVRLANVRDGMEDYEYFALAEKRCGRARVLEILGSVLSSQTRFTRDPSRLRAQRARLADLIEATGR
jgi:hypothetical protein